MAFVYETHLHTMEGSACGKVSGRDYVKFYQDAGYDGIFITDHFYWGNCRPDRELPWEEWVSQYCRGYEAAKEESDKLGFKVFFGIEERFKNDDGYDDEWLIYGLSKEYLLAHPDMRQWTRADYLKNVHAAGGCCVQAHPFRNRDYVHNIRVTLGVDAIEGYNANNKIEADVQAHLYAKKHDLVMVAGGDVHFCGHVPPERMAGVVFEKPLESAKDYVDAILQRKPFTLQKPAGYPDMTTPLPEFDKPVIIYDKMGNRTDWTSDILF